MPTNLQSIKHKRTILCIPWQTFKKISRVWVISNLMKWANHNLKILSTANQSNRSQNWTLAISLFPSLLIRELSKVEWLFKNQKAYSHRGRIVKNKEWIVFLQLIKSLIRVSLKTMRMSKWLLILAMKVILCLLIYNRISTKRNLKKNFLTQIKVFPHEVLFHPWNNLLNHQIEWWLPNKIKLLKT